MYFTLHTDSSVKSYGLAAISDLGIITATKPIKDSLLSSGSTVKELFAIVDAIDYLLPVYQSKGLAIERIAIRSDSLSAIKFGKNAVKGVFSDKPVIRQLQEEFKTLTEGLIVGCKWVKGHVRDKKNNKAAELNCLVDRLSRV